MNKKLLYMLWAGLFVLCAGLGFIPEPEGPFKIALSIISLVFFVPPAWLLYRAICPMQSWYVTFPRCLWV